MRRLRFLGLLFFCVLATVAAGVSAKDHPLESTTRQQFNQVFVKLLVPVTSRTPKQSGPVVESWVTEELKKLSETEYFAVTEWVPVCDALLENDVVDNSVWSDGHPPYCPVGGDIPQRKDGRLLVNISGWLLGGCEANITLSDEPGVRAVGPMQILIGKERKPMKAEEPLPYVAVIIAPPPLEGTDKKMRATVKCCVLVD